jgi:hypothetical protein
MICKNINEAEPFIRAFQIAYALIGLRKEQTPNLLETQVLISFLKNNYRGFGIDEIKTAFEMAASGQLNCDCNAYGQFSAMYLGTILKAYKVEREKAMLEVSIAKQKEIKHIAYIPDTNELIATQKEFDENCIYPIFQQYLKTGKLETGSIPVRLIYTSLVDFHKILTYSKEQKDEVMRNARVSLERKRVLMQSNKSANYNEFKALKSELNALNELDVYNDKLKNECYLLCIEQCFEKIIAEKLNIFSKM